MFSAATGAQAQDEQEEEPFEHRVIVGVGGAAELELGEGSLHPGVNAFVEIEAVENWLELELGASVLAAEGGVEVPIDLLFKKPFRLARHLELMVGLGPELVRVSTPTTKGTFLGAELALDLMFWPSRAVGLWVEPTYDLVFRSGVRQGLGCTGGIIFGW